MVKHITIRSKSNEHSTRSPLKVLVGGILGMMLVMGIGRFAFTPILPLMQRDLGISNSLVGGLASLNYIGYLAGALLCAFWPSLLRRTTINVTALLTSIATTFLMGLTISPYMWSVLRFTAGIASALLFVAIAVEVSEILVRSQHGRWNSALYGGIGFGIALSGAVVPLLDKIGGWRASWLGMGVISLILAFSGIILSGKRHASIVTQDGQNAIIETLSGISRLATAYFLEGFGYIITATFLVTMIAHTPGLTAFSAWSWVAVGLAAAPSTVLWQQLASRIGIREALTLAYLIQSGGLLLSIYATTAITTGIAATIFGGTFLAIVSLSMAEGGRRSGAKGRRAAAILTVAFGSGQVIGPFFAGLLADRHGGFTIPLTLAACAVLFGGILIATDNHFKLR